MVRTLQAASLMLAIVVLEISGSLVMATGASANPNGLTPPGNSGVSQYIEDVPTVRGAKPTSEIVIPPSGGSGPTRPSGPATPPKLPTPVVKELIHAGNAGKNAEAVAQATVSPPVRTKPARVPTPPSSTAGQLVKTLGGSTGGGFGEFLPVFLIAILVIVSALGILGRRKAT
jgi:hypothetical protein